MKKVKLTLYLTYSGKDADKHSIMHTLQHMVEHAADRGLLTGDLDLVVEESTYEIEVSDHESSK